jgi:NAD-dependent deacetylase
MSVDAIAKAAELLGKAQRAVAFTGAGISTESGIPDFRGPGGIWSKYQPVMFQDFLASEQARKRYWHMKKEGFPGMKEATPNAGHKALARLEARGKIAAVITQNIDGLHQDAGSRRVLELHGTSRHCVCLECAARYSSEDIQQRLEAGEEAPLCGRCGGLLKSATISFGQPLPEDVLSEAYELCSNTDLVLAIGSSLVVEPAASLPRSAAMRGASLVIINHTETPLDALAGAVIRAGIGETLTTLEKLLSH